ncbi:MAG: hypothetical protein WAT78_08010 [Rhizobiaceae bacterium]
MDDLAIYPAGPQRDEQCRQFALRAVAQSERWFGNMCHLKPGAPNSQLFDTRFDFHYNRCTGSAGQCMAGDEAWRLAQLDICLPPPVTPPVSAPPAIPQTPPDPPLRIERWRVRINGRREIMRVEIRRNADGSESFAAKGRRTRFSGTLLGDAITVSRGFGLAACQGELRRDPRSGRWQGSVTGGGRTVQISLVRS